VTIDCMTSRVDVQRRDLEIGGIHEARQGYG